jgi:hypothetical protein
VRYLHEGAREPFTAWLARGDATDDVVQIEGVGKPTTLSRLIVERAGTVRLALDPMKLTFVER